MTPGVMSATRGIVAAIKTAPARGWWQSTRAAPHSARRPTAEPKDEKMTIYDFSARLSSGEDRSLADYRGKALLIVNVASKCGFTPQYTGLQRLYQQFSPRGFEIL